MDVGNTRRATGGAAGRSCGGCGDPLPSGARYCPACGEAAIAGLQAEASDAGSVAPSAPEPRIHQVDSVGRALSLGAVAFAVAFVLWMLPYGYMMDTVKASSFFLSILMQPLLWVAIGLAGIAEYRARSRALCVGCHSSAPLGASRCGRCGSRDFASVRQPPVLLLVWGISVLGVAAGLFSILANQ